MRYTQFKKRGAGIHSNIDQLYRYALRMGGVDTSDLLSGEKHVPLYINGKFVSANFAGPGTKLEKRLKRGDKPLSETDKVAMAHDLRYSLATSGQEIANADKLMLNKLKTVKDSAINKYPSSLGISAKYMAEKLIGTKYPNKSQLENNPQKDNEFYKEKLKDLEQQGYGIDPAAHLKLKLMNLKPKQEKSVKGSAVVPYVKPAIQQFASSTIDKVDYSKSEQSGDGCGCMSGDGLRLAGKSGSGCSCHGMSGSGVRLAGGFAFLAPIIPFLTVLGKAVALAAATTATKRGVDAIFDHYENKNKPPQKPIKRGKGVGSDIIDKLKQMKITIKDFSKSALKQIEQFIKDNATKENAIEVVKFLKPFVLAAISAKLNAKVKDYERSLERNEEDEYDWDNFKYDEDEEETNDMGDFYDWYNTDDSRDLKESHAPTPPPNWNNIWGSGSDIPMLKENIISDAEALKIFNKTVDMADIQDGSGVRLAGGFAFLLPFIPFLLTLGKAVALGAAGAAGAAGVNAIVNRKKKKGRGMPENVNITIKDFSQSDLSKMEEFAKKHGSADNAPALIKFFKPFVNNAVAEKMENMQVASGLKGSGLDIPTISDSDALKIFNKTVDVSKLQDGEGLRLAGAPSPLYGRGMNKKTVVNIMNEIKKNPELIKSVDWINEQSKNLNLSGKNILNSFLKKYNSSL